MVILQGVLPLPHAPTNVPAPAFAASPAVHAPRRSAGSSFAGKRTFACELLNEDRARLEPNEAAKTTTDEH